LDLASNTKFLLDAFSLLGFCDPEAPGEIAG
jgi:hypothetical protein